jgi:hypothetical protein
MTYLVDPWTHSFRRAIFVRAIFIRDLIEGSCWDLQNILVIVMAKVAPM